MGNDDDLGIYLLKANQPVYLFSVLREDDSVLNAEFTPSI
jgi:hypothetical protein